MLNTQSTAKPQHSMFCTEFGRRTGLGDPLTSLDCLDEDAFGTFDD